jgi:predicted O-linked N-acetylglucosamine transferase (SPINDLY family)
MAMLEYFGKDITIMPNLTYVKYMQALESCHFSLDSYPFGGYNTVLESLWCGLPFVAL